MLDQVHAKCNFKVFFKFEKYVVFANKPEGLKQWVDKMDFSQTLSQDIAYQEFMNDLPQTANLYQYFNLANFYQVLATSTATFISS